MHLVAAARRKRGKLLAQTVFDAGERARLARYAGRLRSTLPAAPETGPAATAIRKIVEGGGSPNDLASALFGATGKGAGSASVPLAQRLKSTLSPEGWAAVRQGMFAKLTSAGEGKIAFEAQALSQRLHEFLNEGGSQLAKVLYSPQELVLMRKLAAVYKQMTQSRAPQTRRERRRCWRRWRAASALRCCRCLV